MESADSQMFANSLGAEAATAPERAARRAATGVVGLARDLIAARSPNPPGDERAVAAVVVEALHDLGIGDVQVAGRVRERPNVIARVPGRGGGRALILNGHLDTKPPGDLDAWETPPWEPLERDGMLYGLGSADMKGAVAAMIHAAADVARDDLSGELILVLTADEEVGGTGARWLAEEGLIAADAAIIGEPGGIFGDWEAIRLVSRGVCLFRVTLFGTALHSSLSDQVPSVNANVVMGRLISRFAARASEVLSYPVHPRVEIAPTMNPALVAAGGAGHGVLPSSASFVSDIRLVPGMTREQVQEDLERFLVEAALEEPDLDAKVEIEHWYPSCEIDADHPVVDAMVGAARDVLGRVPPFAAFPGGTDAPSFQLTAGIPTVPSFGPGLLTAAHRPNESISVKSIEDATAIYAATARRFLA